MVRSCEEDPSVIERIRISPGCQPQLQTPAVLPRVLRLHEAADHGAVGGLYRPRQVRVPVLHDLGPEHQSEVSISCSPPIRGQHCRQLTNHSSPDHGLLLLLLLLAQPDTEQVRRDLLHAQVHSLPSPDIRIFSSNLIMKYFSLPYISHLADTAYVSSPLSWANL